MEPKETNRNSSTYIVILAFIVSIIIFIYGLLTGQFIAFLGSFLFILLIAIIQLLLGRKEELNPEIEININYKKECYAYNIEERFEIKLINKGNGIANNIIGKILYYQDGKLKNTFLLDKLSEIGAIAPTCDDEYTFLFDNEISNFDGIFIYIIYENPDKKGYKYCSSKYFYFKPSTSKLKEIELRRENKIIYIKELFKTQMVPYKRFAKLTKWKTKSFFDFL